MRRDVLGGLGDAVIVRPDRQGGARLVARILANRWVTL
jgi:hypothetical protein